MAQYDTTESMIAWLCIYTEQFSEEVYLVDHNPALSLPKIRAIEFQIHITGLSLYAQLLIVNISRSVTLSLSLLTN